MNKGTASAFLVLMAITYVLGVLLGIAVSAIWWRGECVEHGCGEYNPKTAVFQWRDCGAAVEAK